MEAESRKDFTSILPKLNDYGDKLRCVVYLCKDFCED